MNTKLIIIIDNLNRAVFCEKTPQGRCAHITI